MLLSKISDVITVDDSLFNQVCIDLNLSFDEMGNALKNAIKDNNIRRVKNLLDAGSQEYISERETYFDLMNLILDAGNCELLSETIVKSNI